jgi:hypothetical protein
LERGAAESCTDGAMNCDDPLALGIVAGYALWVGVARGEEAAKPPIMMI